MLKNLLAIGLTIGLSDRDAFVKKVAGLIEDYQQNPEKADEWANTLAKYLEEIKEDIRTQRNIKAGMADALPAQDIQKLTKAIETLTQQLQQQKD